jgi:hypothetical protein
MLEVQRAKSLGLVDALLRERKYSAMRDVACGVSEVTDDSNTVAAAQCACERKSTCISDGRIEHT